MKAPILLDTPLKLLAYCAENLITLSAACGDVDLYEKACLARQEAQVRLLNAGKPGGYWASLDEAVRYLRARGAK